MRRGEQPRGQAGGAGAFACHRWILAALAFCSLAAAQQPAGPRPDVAGVTLDSKGQPLRKVSLTLLPLATMPCGGELPPYGITSENDGGFALYGIAPGRYRLMAERTGYVKTYFGARNPWAPGAILTLRRGAPLTGIEIRMTEQSDISGRVLLDGSAERAYVTLLQQRYQDGRRWLTPVTSAAADASGEFSFKKLSRGRYYLAALAYSPTPLDPGLGPPTEKYVDTYYPGTIDPGTAEPIELRRGESRSGLDIRLRRSPLFRVGGRVVGSTSPPGRTGVMLVSTGLSANLWVKRATAAADGSFRIESVRPGVYSIVAVTVGASISAQAQQSVEVARDVDGIVLVVDPLPDLHGSLKAAGGPTAVSKLRVRLARADSLGSIFFGLASPTASVEADGAFTLSGVAAGRYIVQIQDLPAGAFLKSATLGDKDVLGGLDLDLKSAEAKLALVVSYAGARVTGTVRGDDGKPVDGIVTLIPDPPKPEQAALYQVADTTEGRFQVQGIRPGKYRLYAWEELESGSHLDPQVTAPYQESSVAIEAAENDRQEVTLKRISVDQVEAAAAAPAAK